MIKRERRPLRLEVYLRALRGRNSVVCRNVLGPFELFLLLLLGELNRCKPFVREGRNKVFVIIVRPKVIEDKQVRSRGWCFRRAGMYRIKEVIVNNMELRTNMTDMKVLNEANCASMQRGGTHILSLLGSRLPLGDLATVLKLRLQDVHGTAPRMGIDKGAEGRLWTRP
jgi:hypothetical protein